MIIQASICDLVKKQVKIKKFVSISVSDQFQDVFMLDFLVLVALSLLAPA